MSDGATRLGPERFRVGGGRVIDLSRAGQDVLRRRVVVDGADVLAYVPEGTGRALRERGLLSGLALSKDAVDIADLLDLERGGAGA